MFFQGFLGIFKGFCIGFANFGTGMIFYVVSEGFLLFSRMFGMVSLLDIDDPSQNHTHFQTGGYWKPQVAWGLLQKTKIKPPNPCQTIKTHAKPPNSLVKPYLKTSNNKNGVTTKNPLNTTKKQTKRPQTPPKEASNRHQQSLKHPPKKNRQNA